MEWFNVDEAIFYGAVWLLAFCSSLFVTLGSSDVESTRKCFSIGGISGFLAFSVVAVLCGRVSEPLSGHWYYLGVSSFIGLSANQQEAIRQRLFEMVFRNGSGNNTPPD